MTIKLIVYGEPKAQPRPRAFARNGKARVFDPGTAEGWKSLIALAYRHAGSPTVGDAPVELRIGYAFRRPRSHYGTGRNAAQLKPQAPRYMTCKPDLDNLDKAVKDALTTLGVWTDDSQVVAMHSTKAYAQASGATIEIQPLGAKENGDE